jgi:hypothetical protein
VVVVKVMGGGVFWILERLVVGFEGEGRRRVYGAEGKMGKKEEKMT